MAFSAYIVEAVRTAGGKKNGSLSKLHPTDLGAIVVNEIINRTGINPASVDDVIFGCLNQIGAQSGNIGRNVVLSSILPVTVPGVSVDRQAGSSQQAVHFAAQAVMSGVQDCVIAGGVEVMSLIPLHGNVSGVKREYAGRPHGIELERKFEPFWRYPVVSGGETMAKKYNITREDLENFSVSSHENAHNATINGYFKREIVPVKLKDENGNEIIFDKDEGIRYPVDLEKMRNLPPLKKEGIITAASSSQITDGAAAVLICNERGLQKLGLKPRAKIIALSVIGSDPVVMLGGPIPATKKILSQSGMTIDQIDLYEVNEAFGSVPLAWAKAVGARLDKMNVNGGAMALGHPIGGTGAKLLTTLLHELERRHLTYGLLTICEGGGLANALIIQVLHSGSKL